MNYSTISINPYYAARLKRVVPSRTEEPNRPVYARLPLAPRNASPVPHLTSLYHFHRAGDYGNRQWPGNCGGNLIKDLLNYFRPKGLVFDPCAGSGTARDVCEELGIPCFSFGHPPRLRRLRPERFPGSGDVRFHLGSPTLLAAENLC